MAVVTRYTNGYPNPNPNAGQLGYMPTSNLEARANVKSMFFSIGVVAGDSINSVYLLGRVPSNALLLPMSNLYATANAGLTSLSVGLDNLGGTVVAGAMMSAVDVHLGGAFAMLSAVGAANYNKRVWQLLGLNADPNAMIDVKATVLAAPSAAGTISGVLLYSQIGV